LSSKLIAKALNIKVPKEEVYQIGKGFLAVKGGQLRLYPQQLEPITEIVKVPSFRIPQSELMKSVTKFPLLTAVEKAVPLVATQLNINKKAPFRGLRKYNIC
jgi:hypothetical protein